MSEAAPTDSRKRLSIRTPDELAAMTFDDSHVILGPHVLSRGQNACIVGPGGVGKTRLLYQMAICTTIGRKFLGFTTPNPNLKWLFIQVENDNRRLAYDFSKYKKWVSVEEWVKISKQIYVHTLETDDDGFLSLDLPRNRTLVSECIGDLRPNMVVWDALIDFGFGDLNHDVAMFASLSEISRITKCGDPLRNPFPIHHAITGKEAAGKAVGWERAGYGKGSKALHMWARLQINIAPGNEAGDMIIVGAGKCSDSKEFQPFAARLNPETMIYERDSEFSIKRWQADVARKNAPAITEGEIADFCGMDGLARKELVKLICSSAECVEKTATRSIDRAVSRGKIRFIPQSEKYVKSHAATP